jgi:hypothetical protein
VARLKARASPLIEQDDLVLANGADAVNDRRNPSVDWLCR